MYSQLAIICHKSIIIFDYCSAYFSADLVDQVTGHDVEKSDSCLTQMKKPQTRMKDCEY